MIAVNKVLLILLLIAAAALSLCGFVSHAPNRLITGRPIALDIADNPTFVIVAIGLLTVAFLRPGRIVQWTEIGLALAALTILLAAAGHAAAGMANADAPAARTSLGAGFWIGLTCGGLMAIDGLQRLKAGIGAQIFLAVLASVALWGLAHAGVFDALSIAREYQNRRAAFSAELIRHCWLAGSAIGFALLIGLPLGIYLTRAHAVEGPVMSVLNVVQTVPSIALFGLLIAPLSALGKAIPGLGISGIGFAPAVIALTLYALLPIVRNTLAGIGGVDAAIVESARGAGMTGGQILRKVELPLALPIILTGIRIVTVQAIGLAVVAALIGAGGLGTFVFQGLGQYATDLVLLGALPAIALALGADFTLRSVETLLARRPAR